MIQENAHQIHDIHEIDNDIEEQPAPQLSSKCWITNLPDSIPVTELSIPGTHDSAAFYTPIWYHKVFSSFAWKTQNRTIENQLALGIRFFDIRVKCQEGQKLTLWHDIVCLGEFQKVIGPIYRFLKEMPKEFVILLFQKERGTENFKSSGEKILREIKQFTNNQIPIYRNNNNFRKMPTVGELKGKIWIIEAYPGNKNRVDLEGHLQVATWCSTKIMSDSRTYILQNYWEGPTKMKKEVISQVLNDTPKHLLKINFLTQSNIPRYFASYYNNWFLNMIKQRKLRNLGIIILDFPSQQLVSQIINSNF